MAEVASIIEGDKNVRVIFKEFPIFGARLRICRPCRHRRRQAGQVLGNAQGSVQHDGPVTEGRDAARLASDLGLDMAKLEADMKDESVEQHACRHPGARQTLCNSTGTPAFIVDDKVFPGYIPKEELLKAIADVRSAGCKFC